MLTIAPVLPMMAGLTIVICMLTQHVFITSAARNREHFFRAWKRYRRNIAFCRFVSILALFVIAWVIAEHVYAADSKRPFAEGIIGLLSTREYTTLVLVTFLLSLLKFLIEEQIEKRIRKTNPTVKDIVLSDVWLLWFVFSVLVSVLLGSMNLLGKVETGSGQLFWAIMTIVVITLTYDFWIYNVIFRQLTLGDGFTGSSVAQLYGASARWPQLAFVGFLFRSIGREPPVQVLAIGPKGAGKTFWIAQHDQDFAQKVKDSEAGRTEYLSTEGLQVGSTTEKIPIVQGDKTIEPTFSISFIDFPGENIGDHCRLPFQLRTDALVLILPEEAFDSELDKKSVPIRLQRSEDLYEYFGASLPSDARDYVYALYYGLNVDEDSVEFTARQSGGIGSFVLLVNTRSKKKELKYGDTFMMQMKSLSEQLGSKFGVREEDRCFSYYFNIEGMQEPILRNAIRSLHRPL